MKIKSIFDSNSEERIFKRLQTYWGKYVDVYPQIPLKTVLGYNEISNLGFSKKKLDYLLKTSFDFIVCSKGSGIPFLAIEFDGIGGGFSVEDNYVSKNLPANDQFRELKLKAKLELCKKFNFPIIVLSYPEIEILKESGGWISILDVIIGDAIEKNHFVQNYEVYSQMFRDAYESGYEDVDIEIDTLVEMANPIKQKIREITKGFPTWPMQIIFPEKRKNFLKGTFSLNAGINTVDGETVTKKLILIELQMRYVGVFENDPIFLFNTIGEYCLARKTQKKLGYDLEKWNKKLAETEWTKL